MLELERLSKTYADATHALADVTLEVRESEIVSVVGGSGCGKTTLLRLIAGLDRPSAGAILLDGERGRPPRRPLPPGRRAPGRAAPGGRHRLPGAAPPAVADRRRQCRLRARRPLRRRAPRPGRARAPPRRAGRACRSLAARAVRRPAAAGGDRPRLRDRAEGAPPRRGALG